MISVHKIFRTIQGEGPRAGQVAIFVRLAGCNVWSGKVEHRARDATRGACALWCDTDFSPQRKMSPTEIFLDASNLWGTVSTSVKPYVVFTGGEPMLQLADALIAPFDSAGWVTAVETNGSIVQPSVVARLHDVVVSPKRGVALADWSTAPLAGVHLKVVLPGDYDNPWRDDEVIDLYNRIMPVSAFVVPQDDAALITISTKYQREVPSNATHRERCARFVMQHPEFKLGIQMHKQFQLE